MGIWFIDKERVWLLLVGLSFIQKENTLRASCGLQRWLKSETVYPIAHRYRLSQWRLLPSPLFISLLQQPFLLLPPPTPTKMFRSFLLPFSLHPSPFPASLQTPTTLSISSTTNLFLPLQGVSLSSPWLLLSPVANPRKASFLEWYHNSHYPL